jgi:UDPglucose 6-dehydrogenase
MSSLAVIGTGYVGLTSGVCFAKMGHQVTCFDIDEKKVSQLEQGLPTIHESGIGQLLSEGMESGHLRFTTSVRAAVENCDFVMLCVPTPSKTDGSVDFSYVKKASESFRNYLKPGAIVINKSTVPVGSTKLVEAVLQRPDVSVVSNPEFLREGSAVEDFFHPDRIVVGATEVKDAQKVADLYKNEDVPLVLTDPATAETIKYVANAFLATKLSFINAVAAICEGVGADIGDLTMGIGLDERIGKSFLKPGPGWGGSCFPKDTRALLHIAQESGYQFKLLEGVLAVNDQQMRRVVEKVRTAVGGELNGTKVAVWGLTFKANTDDLRESPALVVIKHLIAEGAKIQAWDPAVKKHSAVIPQQVDLGEGPYSVCRGAKVLVVLTEWDEFGLLDAEKTAQEMERLSVVDTRNVLNREIWQMAGFTHQGIGR